MKRGFGLPNIHLERRVGRSTQSPGLFLWQKEGILEGGTKNTESKDSIQKERWTGDILPVSRTSP